MQGEVGIQPQRRGLAGTGGELPAQGRERGVAQRLQRVQAVHPPAQQHQQEAGVVCAGRGQREFRQCRQRQCGGAEAQEPTSIDPQRHLQVLH